MNYDNRVVLFLDILAFKNKVEDTVDKKNGNREIDNVDKIEQLHDILNNIQNVIKPNSDKKYNQISTQFSDSLVVSYKENEGKETFELFNNIQSLIIYLIKNKIICRGAISYGKLIHKKSIIFGPALVDAYLTESKAALYPRIILDKSIVDIGVRYQIIKNSKQLLIFGDSDVDYLIKQYLNKDTDEKYYIDYFISAVNKIKKIPELEDYLKSLRNIIEEGMNHNSPDVKIKYGWMKNKYNNMIKYFKEMDNRRDNESEKNKFMAGLDYI